MLISLEHLVGHKVSFPETLVIWERGEHPLRVLHGRGMDD